MFEDVREWQNRPLESVYAVVLVGALRVRIRAKEWSGALRLTWRLIHEWTEPNFVYARNKVTLHGAAGSLNRTVHACQCDLKFNAETGQGRRAKRKSVDEVLAAFV